MKKFCTLFFIILAICSFQYSLNAQSILNPKDSVADYDPSIPPVEPNWGKIGKWIRTKSIITWNTDSYKAYIYEGSCFRLKFPKTYDPAANDGKKYPVAIFFHGMGEAGPITDNETHLIHGGQPYMNVVDDSVFDGYVLFMQSQFFWGATSYAKIIDIINYMIVNNKLDPFRISVNGLSAGGQASWEMLLSYPNYITASLPMSASSTSYADPSVVKKIKFTPVWNFQGDLDENPSPYVSGVVKDAVVNAGGNFTYKVYSNIGHGVWDSAFAEPDFFPFMARGYASNPWPLYGRTGFCTGDTINITIGLAPGYDQYEWRNNGQTIPTATSNTLKVTALGIYDARVRRGNIWSDWSHISVNVHITPRTITPPIKVSGLMSNVLVSGDGKNYVNLEIPDNGYTSYAWKKIGSDSVIGTNRIYEATQPGQYMAVVTEKYGCSSIYSPPFAVINASGLNAPDAASNLYANSLSSTKISLSWLNNPHPINNETYFEIYRSASNHGNYNFVGKVPADTLEFIDSTLFPGISYFYKIRAINNNGAAPMSNIANAFTLDDKTLPTPPNNLRTIYTTTSSISIEWDSSSDNVGVKSYEIYVNGEKSYSTTNNEFILSGLQKSKLYSIYVKSIDSSGNNSEKSNSISATAASNGLLYKYYEGYWTSLPDFNSLTPKEIGVCPNLNLRLAKRKVQFGFLWKGYLNVPQDGKYRFRMLSDDGSRMWLDNYDGLQPPVLDNDHLKADSKSQSIFLSKGPHLITISYFQLGTSRNLELTWMNPDFFGDTLRHIIEGKYFSTGDSINADLIPAKPGNISSVVLSYDKINLSWGDNSNNETGFQIYRSLKPAREYSIIKTTTSNQTSFVDSNLTPRTKYFYKVNAVNNYGTSAFTDSTSAKTLIAPGKPEPRTNFAAKAISSSTIQLNWTDIDTTEIHYTVFRSTDDSDYKLAAVLPANSTSFVDTGLYGNTTYFYKVFTVSKTSSSNDKGSKSAKTQNNAPVINNKFTQKYVPNGIQSVVSLTAKDPDLDQISFYALNLPSFVTLVDNGNGTASLIVNPSQLNTYSNISIIAKDTLNGKDTMTFNLVVNNDSSPSIDNIANYTINEGDTLSLSLNATDQDASDVLTWTISGVPDSYLIQSVSNGKINLVLSPNYIAAGTYAPQVTVSDGNGGTATKQFVLTVNDKNPDVTVYIRFKDVDSAGNPWNDITSVSSTNLKDNLNRNTGMGLSMQAGWWSTFNNGPNTGNNTGIYPDNVLKDYYFFGSYPGVFTGPETVTSKITGLDTSKIYNLSFYSGSVWSVLADNGTTIFTIGNVSKSLNVQNNTTNTADFVYIKPDSDGTITFKMSKGLNTQVGYLNAIVVKWIYTDTLKPAAPANLTAINVPGKGVQLAWNDVAYNEINYNVYRATNAAGPFSLINGSLPSNTVSFLDSVSAGNTDYFYMVKASNTKYYSDESNVVEVLTTDRVPRLEPIANVVIKNNQQRSIIIKAVDDLSDHITLNVSNLPSFVTFSDNGNGTGLLTMSPSTGTSGTYEDVTISATDNSDSTSTMSFNITVTDQNINSVYVNFSDGTPASYPWNNFTGTPFAGATLSNLVDDDSITTAISLKLINGFTGFYAGGMQPQNGKGIYPYEVMRTSFYESTSKIDSILVSGLDRSKKYNFVFFNSHDDGLKGNTTFTTGNSSVTLNPAYNIDRTVQLNGIIPDAAGNAIIKVSKLTGEDYAYINSLIIQAYDSSFKLLSPTDLRVTSVTRNTVAIRWADRSDDETGFEIWRSADSASANYSLIKTVGANVTSLIDSNLTSEQTYYYVVRTIKAGVQSGYSNAVAATTYTQAVYINFAYLNKASTPWNNTSALPDLGLKWNNLMDDTGTPSSVNMEELSLFAGLYGAGMTTGDSSGIFPDAVMADSYGLFPGQSATMKVSGLNLNKRYDFTFFASSQSPGDVNVAYTVNGSRTILNASLNTRGTSTIYNITPDKNGEAVITIAPNTYTSQFGLIGALIIQSYKKSDKAIPPVPQAANKAAIASAVSKASANSVSKTDLSKKTVVYPNPFIHDYMLSISLKEEDNIKVELYSINGKLITRRILGDFQKGSYTIKIPVDANIAKGVYIVKVIYTKSGTSESLKILKQ